MAKTTKYFDNRLEKANSEADLQSIISELPRTTFVIRVDELREQYGLTFSWIQTESSITKSLFYSIVNGTRKPKKAHIIKIGIAMKLSIEELNELLKLAKHKELYAKNRDDAIIIFGLKNNLKIEDIENLLTQYKSEFHLMDYDKG